MDECRDASVTFRHRVNAGHVVNVLAYHRNGTSARINSRGPDLYANFLPREGAISAYHINIWSGDATTRWRAVDDVRLGRKIFGRFEISYFPPAAGRERFITAISSLLY